MLFKRRQTERKPSDPESVPDPSAAKSPDADSDAANHRSLGSLIENENRAGSPRQDRYRAMLAMMESEGGARPASSSSPESSGFQYTVESGRRNSGTPEIEIRFSKCVPAEGGARFELQAPQARSVEIALDFGDWKPEPMTADPGSPGCWRITKPLPRGEFRYKFIIDGQWMNDPLNPLMKPNPFGGEDSIIRVSSGP